jgi:pyrroline-5-carboxylate reductase
MAEATLGVIGGGIMGEALIVPPSRAGMFLLKTAFGSAIRIRKPSPVSVRNLWDIQVVADNQSGSLNLQSGVVLLAVKPQILPTVSWSVKTLDRRARSETTCVRYATCRFWLGRRFTSWP